MPAIMWNTFWICGAMLATTLGSPTSRQLREEESDVFEKWMQEIGSGFDKDWEDFMKEVEGAASQADKRSQKRSEDSTMQDLFMESMKQILSMAPSDATEDKVHEMTQSVQNDMRKEFKIFMDRIIDQLRLEFTRFVDTTAAEMTANFEEIMANMEAENSRKVQEEYKSRYDTWWGVQVQSAYSQFVEFQSSYTRKRRDAEDTNKNAAEYIPAETAEVRDERAVGVSEDVNENVRHLEWLSFLNNKKPPAESNGNQETYNQGNEVYEVSETYEVHETHEVEGFEEDGNCEYARER